MRRIVVISIVAVVVALVIWAPWLTRQVAEDKVMDRFNSIWEGVVDGCGFDCKGCGVIGAERTWLGYKVEIEYGCGLIPEDSPQYHQFDQAFVSVFGIVTGLDAP
ncbi:MAG: hypothetical protein JSV37_07050 [Anaerolineaceae bacterium]|nr:MAG: hypothetical protein JSV37_07050 [Anaerolineaceae bacterium]